MNQLLVKIYVISKLFTANKITIISVSQLFKLFIYLFSTEIIHLFIILQYDSCLLLNIIHILNDMHISVLI